MTRDKNNSSEFYDSYREKIKNKLKSKIDQTKKETEDEIANFEKTLQKLKAPLKNDEEIYNRQNDPLTSEILKANTKKSQLEFKKKTLEKKNTKNINTFKKVNTQNKYKETEIIEENNLIKNNTSLSPYKKEIKND